MAEADSNSLKPPRGRRWFRFSLRLLFIVMTIAAVWLGFTMKRIRERHEAIETIRSMGGRVIFGGVAGSDAEIGPGAPPWLRNLLGEHGKHVGSSVEKIVLAWPDHPPDDDKLIRSVAALSESREFVLQVNSDDRGLLALPELPNFHVLYIRPRRRGSVSQEGLQCLDRMPKLYFLQVHDVTLGPQGYRQIAGCSGLKMIELIDCALSADGLDQLTTLKELSSLDFMGCSIGDESVGKLSRLTTLKSLTIRSTKFTRNGIEALRAALPNCNIDSDLNKSSPVR
jgi:hypothetical protein